MSMQESNHDDKQIIDYLEQIYARNQFSDMGRYIFPRREVQNTKKSSLWLCNLFNPESRTLVVTKTCNLQTSTNEKDLAREKRISDILFQKVNCKDNFERVLFCGVSCSYPLDCKMYDKTSVSCFLILTI